MADWIIDRAGEPVQILDEYCFRSLSGEVTAWLFGNGVYSLKGDHIGWFEMSTLYDLHNGVIGMLQQACTSLPAGSMPDEMPSFARRPMFRCSRYAACARRQPTRCCHRLHRLPGSRARTPTSTADTSAPIGQPGRINSMRLAWFLPPSCSRL
jgi:hypothetical protein